MNHIYRLVWNYTHDMLIAVSEIAGSRNKGGTPRRRRRVEARALSLTPVASAVLLALGLAPALAWALPTGGQVVSGQASLNQNGTTLTVEQGSQSTILNWQGFSIGANETVNFDQPGASSVALNRVLGADPSSIYGHLNANGQVFLVNPNGIYFAPNAQVDVNGLVASTLNITNDDFLSGHYRFSGDSSASVQNRGDIQGGYVAFIGRTVENDGTIATPGGTTALGAGGAVELTLAGDRLVSFQVSKAALDALAANGGIIQADGGTVILSAEAKDALLRTVVNNTGMVQAEAVAEHNGVIELLGGDSGTVQVAGTLDASGGQGEIETSGAHLEIGAAKIDAGTGGTWLVDPVDLTIDSTAAGTIDSTLNAGTNVTEETTATTASGSGTQTSGNGDINVESAINWTSDASLSLSAYHSVNVDAAITATGANAGLVLDTNNNSGGTSSGGSLNINAPVTLSGASPSLAIDGTSYTVVNSISALQNINSGLSGHYALGTDLDDSNAAFTPIGSSSTEFTGTLDGLGHTVANLYIDQSGSNDVGLVSELSSSGVVRNLGLTGESVTSDGQYTGGLVGYNNGGTIDNDYATGSVSGNTGVGGLVGFNYKGNITNAHAAVSVNGTGYRVGGLAGINYGTINNAYATGSVSGGGFYTGGLVGEADSGTITNAYATGNVTGGYGAGGLIGYNCGNTITNAYATGNVTGDIYVGGLVGSFDGGAINDAYATGSVSGTTDVGGLIGWHYVGTITDTYWDTTTSGMTNGVGSGSTTDVTGLTTANLAAALPAGFSSNVWGNGDNQTTPYLLANASFGTVSGSVYLGSDIGATPTAYNVLLTMSQLQNINSTGLGLNYVLGTGLTDTVTTGSGFTPIGNSSTEFTGTLDGLGHTVADLYIDQSSNDYIGLFGDVGSSGVVRNLGLTDENVSGHYVIGGLAAYNNGGTIDNDYVTGSVSGAYYTGGLVGKNYGGTIDNDYATGSVSGGCCGFTGGLVGRSDNGTITNDYATGNVSGAASTGGLIGHDNRSTITNDYATGNVRCTTNGGGGLIGTDNAGTISDVYATGDVTGSNSEIGGLVGESAWDTINNAYATGNVNGFSSTSSRIGGLVGYNYHGTINDAYATGSVSGSAAVNGLVGFQYGTVTDGYWDTTTSGITTTSQTGVTGLTTAELAATLPTGFSSSVWGNGDNQTTPYLLANASFDTVSGSVYLGSDTSAAPTAYNVLLTMSQLQNINSTGLGLNYILGTDITDTVNTGSGFTPIGSSSSPFTGTLDGLGHTVANLYIDQSSINNVGLVSTLSSSGVVRNLGLTGENVTGGYEYTGGLIGYNNGGTIDNDYATGSVNGGYGVGGLVGINNGGNITNAHSAVSVNGTGYRVGGLAGINYGTINNAYATGSVSGGGFYTGGLVGEADSGTISNAYATGNVTGGYGAGGLIGYNCGNTITNAYATGSVTGDIYAGGLVGSFDGGAINDAYATGSVSGTTDVGGLVGWHYVGTITDTYWDTTTSGMTNGVGSGSTTNVTGLTDSQMYLQSSFVGFDFTNIWTTNGDTTMPKLQVF